MISVVWITSGIICFPPLAGWSRPQPIVNGRPLCVLSEEPGYVIYSIIGSFYLPLCVMAVVYLKIYLAARWRARRHLQGASGRRSGFVELQPTALPRTPPPDDRIHAHKVTSCGAEAGVESSGHVGSTNDDTLRQIHGGVEAPVVTEAASRRAVIVVTHVDDDDDDAVCPPVTGSAARAASTDVCSRPSADKPVFDVEVSIDHDSCSPHVKLRLSADNDVQLPKFFPVIRRPRSDCTNTASLHDEASAIRSGFLPRRRAWLVFTAVRRCR